MTYVDNMLGNLLIKYHDRWRGDYYLKEDLTFSTNRNDAARFYLLKAGDTAILNGDRVSVHIGNRTLIIDSDNKVKLIDRERLLRETNSYKINSFILTNGTDETDPINYDVFMFFISDKNTRTALKYEWGMELVNDQSNINVSTSDLPVSNISPNYKPRTQPNLTNGNYNADIPVNLFRFLLERAEGPIINSEEARAITTATIMSPTKALSKSDTFDGYRGAIMIVLLMIILILCMFLNR